MTKTCSSTSGESPGLDAIEPALVRLSQQGDREAFGRLYDTYVERIRRFIYLRVTDAELAEDITSLVFLKVWEKLPAYQAGRAPFSAWLYRIARNAVIDNYRTRKVSLPLDETNLVVLSHADDVDEKLDLQAITMQLGEALRGLTDMQRQVLTLKFVHGFSTQEIARKLYKQEGAVRALQLRCLRGLARSPALERGEQVDH